MVPGKVAPRISADPAPTIVFIPLDAPTSATRERNMRNMREKLLHFLQFSPHYCNTDISLTHNMFGHHQNFLEYQIPSSTLRPSMEVLTISHAPRT